MAHQIFLSGIGTGIGKTLVSGILVKALEAGYWKPVQAGDQDTDSDWISSHLNNPTVYPEVYKLKLAASPHIAAREEAMTISIDEICSKMPSNDRNLIIEGPGGLMVPLNGHEFVYDLIRALNVKVILVSRNYLGSINHSLLTAALCKEKNIPVIGWIFNDQYLSYEQEIAYWTGYPRLGSIPFTDTISDFFITTQAGYIRDRLSDFL